MPTKTDERTNLAAACWKIIKGNLDDRSVLELGSVDADTLAELEREQINAIEGALADWGQFCSPYTTRSYGDSEVQCERI